MNIPVDPAHMNASGATFTDRSLVVNLTNGRTVTVPLAWFPRLLHATEEQRSNYELLGGGQGIHWPDIDEDISVQGLLLGVPSAEAENQARAS